MADYLEEKDFTAPGWVILQQVRAYYDHDKKADKTDPEIIIARIGLGCFIRPQSLGHFQGMRHGCYAGGFRLFQLID